MSSNVAPPPAATSAEEVRAPSTAANAALEAPHTSVAVSMIHGDARV
ncbi:hypothetical protein [Nocardia rosealba]|nr:hypothetical protein [Nocardia rosealba]MCA2210532.1 hypothetical protein [Nocardia rosealba]